MRGSCCSAAAAACTLARSARSICCTLTLPCNAGSQCQVKHFRYLRCATTHDAACLDCLSSVGMQFRSVFYTQPYRLQDGIYLDARGCNVCRHMLAGCHAASCDGHIRACSSQGASGLHAKPSRAACVTGVESLTRPAPKPVDGLHCLPGRDCR